MVPTDSNSTPFKVALIQHYLVHYRHPVFNLLCHQEPPNPVYTIFSDVVGRHNIQVIDFTNNKSAQPSEQLRWFKLINIWIGQVLLWQIGILRIVSSNEFDCIIFPGSMFDFSTWVATILARIRGKRVLMWTHGYLREERNLKGWVRCLFYRLANGILLYGNRAQAFLVSRNFRLNDLYVVYNSLNTKVQRRVREATELKKIIAIKDSIFKLPSHPVVIFIGRLTPQKKLYQVLEAMKILNQKDFPINLLLVGDGPDRLHLQSIARTYGLEDQIVFFGPCYNEEDLGPLIMLSDLCVAPGEVGLTCMHSFAYGTPVLTHDDPNQQMPESEAIVPGLTGAFFRYGDVDDLAHTIQQWLSSVDSREKIAKRCHAVIDTFYNPEYQVKIINQAVRGLPAQ